ncbi:flippase [Paraburkholderia terrae]|uniref:Flippase n=1 Tax=Paraburkholderia terrae TaxID=311230 RepID=A0A2I8ESI7_9BURK|nr:flippase [Paraburkholderia terrae]AUT62231.1 flippase [Paraburkholderia terrae]
MARLPDTIARYTESSSLARNLTYNIFGQLIPLALAAISIPMLIHHMGKDRFGLLTIAWMVVGYFNLFDLGLGRALTRLVAERIGAGRTEEVPQIISTGLVLMTGLGVAGAITVAIVTPALTTMLKVPVMYVGESRTSFYLLALSIPSVILTTGLRGILEAFQRFDITNALRTPLGLWTFGGPLCVLPFSDRLDWIVLSLVLGRVVSVAVHWYCTAHQIGGKMITGLSDRRLCKELLSFGGWMTVSNIVSPMMVYMDRFFIGALLGTTAVAFYTTPYEVVFKLNIVSEGLFGVLFPLMASRFAVDRSQSGDMLMLGAKLITACLFPLVLLVVAFARPFLKIWIGHEFAERSACVMQLLAIGLFINGFSKVAFNLLQAQGRADVTAKLHLIELPVYVMGLVLLTKSFGIVGAAAGWALRMILDAGLLYWMSLRVAGVKLGTIRVISSLAILCIIALWGTFSITSLWASSFVVVALLIGFVCTFWKCFLSDDDRQIVTVKLFRAGR